MELSRAIRLNQDTNLLKLVAIITMMIDHMGKMLFPQYPIFRIIGRIAFPLFSYCMAVGCTYTHDFKRYVGRVALLFLISQPLYVLALGGGWFKFNILLALVAGMLVVGSLHRGKIGLAAVALAASFIFQDYLDYGFRGILLMLLFYALYDKPALSFLAVGGFMFLWGMQYGGYSIGGLRFSTQMFALMALPLIYIPTHSGLKLNKYVFYAFYPAHLLVIYILCQIF